MVKKYYIIEQFFSKKGMYITFKKVKKKRNIKGLSTPQAAKQV